MGLTKLGCSPYPTGANDEDNLHYDEVAQTQRLFQRNTLFFNFALCTI
jgi:hypothetical protein